MNPLSLQQSLQATNIEALRMAQGFNEGQAREAMQKRVLDDRTAQEQSNVPGIPHADGLKAEERQGKDTRQGRKGAGGSGQEETPPGASPASPAPPHVDILA